MSDQRSLWKSTSNRGMKMTNDSNYSGSSSGGGKKCAGHDGSAKVAVLARGVVVAGAQGSIINYNEADIVVDCAGLTREVFRKSGSSVLSGTDWLVEALAPTTKHPDTLFIDWPDMGIPRVSAKFWRELFRVTPDKSRVVFACIGSHGRTGTALACYIAASMPAAEVPDAVDLIRLVRARHCGHAIETQAQDDYIARVVAEFRAPGSKAEVDRQYSLLDAAKGERAAAKAATKAAVAFVDEMKPKKEAPPKAEAPGLEPVGALVELDDEPEQDEAMPKDVYKFMQLLPISTELFRDASGSVVDQRGEQLWKRSTMTDEVNQWLKARLRSWGEEIERRALGKGAAQ